MHPVLARAAAVIFDFDGVLVDSEPLHEEAIRQVATSRGWTMTRDHFFQMVGKGDDHAFELLAHDHRQAVTAEDVRRMCEVKHVNCLKLIEAGRFAVQPGAAEVVSAASRGGRVPVGVCSGSRREVVMGMLTRAGLAGAMGTVVTHDDVARSKPDPEGYLLAASRLGASPAQCIVIEDSPTGIRAGRAAGMTVIAVGHSFGAERLREADLFVDRIGDLLAERP